MAHKRVEISWTDIKSYKTRDGFSLSYVSNPDGTYEAVGVSNRFEYHAAISVATDITDFEANFKSASSSVTTIDAGIAAANQFDSIAVRSFTTDASVEIHGEVTTASTTANQTVITYTVPAGKNFFLVYSVIQKVSVNSVDMAPGAIRKNGTDLYRRGVGGSASGSSVYELRVGPPGVSIATAGDVLTLTVTPGGTGSTTWGAVLMGYLVSI